MFLNISVQISQFNSFLQFILTGCEKHIYKLNKINVSVICGVTELKKDS